MARAHTSPQRSFGDPEVILQEYPLPEDGFEVRFRTMADELLPNSLFAGLYSDRGRPAISPSLLTRVLLLQLKYGRSDREAVADLQYDLRWRYMCDVTAAECDFHPTVLVYHRLRLLWGTINRERIAQLQRQAGDALAGSPVRDILQQVVQAAVAAGLVNPEAAQGIDSTAILGAAAIQDCFRLLFQGIRQVLQAHAQVNPQGQEDLLARLCRQEYLSAKHTKPVIEWTDAQARAALLMDYVRDAATLQAACADLDDESVRETLAQLLRLIDQDLLVSEAGQATLKKEVAPDRQCSVVDPQMRHGRKSRSKRFNGYKAHITVEPESELITGVVVTAASTHDSRAVEPLLEQAQAAVLVGDNAYSVLEVRAAAVAAGTAIVTPTAPRQPFEKDSFVLDEEAGTMTCPGGVTVKICPQGKVRFPVSGCRQCPWRDACKPSKRGREFTLRFGETLARNLRAFARTESGRALVRQIRPTTERIIGHLVRCGIRQGRYFGRLKTGLQTVLGAISYNLDKIGRLKTRSASPSGRPGNACASPNTWLQRAMGRLRPFSRRARCTDAPWPARRACPAIGH